MAAIYSNGGNRWNILGFNFTKRDALSSLYKISMCKTSTFQSSLFNHISLSGTVCVKQPRLQTFVV